MRLASSLAGELPIATELVAARIWVIHSLPRDSTHEPELIK